MAHAFAKIHVARKQLGLDEDTTRDLYARVTGKRSLRAMNAGEITAVNKEMERLGFKPSKTSKRAQLTGHYAPILRALWMSAYNLGVVRNKDDRAMIQWVYRQTQIEHLNWLRDPESATKAIDALKLWMRRQSGCPELYTESKGNWAHDFQRFSPQVQVIYCQFAILIRAGEITVGYGISDHLEKFLGPKRYADMVNHDRQTLLDIQNDLGKHIRNLNS